VLHGITRAREPRAEPGRLVGLQIKTRPSWFREPFRLLDIELHVRLGMLVTSSGQSQRLAVIKALASTLLALFSRLTGSSRRLGGPDCQSTALAGKQCQLRGGGHAVIRCWLPVIVSCTYSGAACQRRAMVSIRPGSPSGEHGLPATRA
jgi:hypothetical protein